MHDDNFLICERCTRSIRTGEESVLISSTIKKGSKKETCTKTYLCKGCHDVIIDSFSKDEPDPYEFLKKFIAKVKAPKSIEIYTFDYEEFLHDGELCRQSVEIKPKNSDYPVTGLFRIRHHGKYPVELMHGGEGLNEFLCNEKEFEEALHKMINREDIQESIGRRNKMELSKA